MSGLSIFDHDAFVDRGMKLFARKEFGALKRKLGELPVNAMYRPEFALLQAAVCAETGEPAKAQRWLARCREAVPTIDEFRFLDRLLSAQGSFTEGQSHYHCLREYLRFQKHDSFLISYPKCGRTWLRGMIGHCLAAHAGISDCSPLDLSALTVRMQDGPTIDVSHDDCPHWKPVDQICVDKSHYRGKRVLFLVRDPRDIVVSYYFEYTRRGSKDFANDSGFNGTISDFIRHPIGGISNIVCFLNVWARNRTVPAAFALLTYEELHADTGAALAKCLGFLGIDLPDRRVLSESVAAFSFSNMQRLEGDASGTRRLRPGDPADPESFKVRRGKVSGYRDYLSENDTIYVNDVIAKELSDFYGIYK